MLKARIAKEIVIRTHDTVGALAHVAKILADKGINVTAACTWIEPSGAVFRMITEDNLRFSDELRAKGADMQETEVVFVDVAHQVGLLRVVTERLEREGINISHLYATATKEQTRCAVVLATSNNERSVVLLNERL
jgi:hypothetical protein